MANVKVFIGREVSSPMTFEVPDSAGLTWVIQDTGRKTTKTPQDGMVRLVNGDQSFNMLASQLASFKNAVVKVDQTKNMAEFKDKIKIVSKDKRIQDILSA